MSNVFRRAAMSLAALCLLGRAGLAQGSSDTLSLSRRIVAATRIYNAVQSSFAHWDGVPTLDFDREYAAYVDAIAKSSDRRAFDLASMEFVAKLGNGHTWFGDWWLRRRDGQALGFYAHPIDGKWTVTESAIASLPVGSVIEGIDSIPILQFYKSYERLMFASDDRWRERSLFEHPYLFPRTFTLHLAGGAAVAIDRKAPFSFHGDDFPGDVITTRDDVMVIRVPSFSKSIFEDSALAAARSAKGKRAVILDLRGNHGGNVPNRLVRAFMDRPYRNWMQSTPSSVAMFRSWGVIGPHAQIEWASEPGPTPTAVYAGPLFILVDGGCYSACEDAVMPFLDTHRATVIGETTAGSSAQSNVVDLGDGMAVGVAMVRFRLPDGRPFESVGLTPDVIVKTSVDDLRRGVDPVLAAALQRVPR